MRLLKKPLSILLSFLMIFSVFTIIPMTTASADGETVTVFARKWVKAELVNGDYFRVSDLYQNFKICRVNPGGGFDNTDFDTNQSAVWNQTGDMALAANGENKLTINSWGLTAEWGYDNGTQGDGYIYLSTYETGETDYNNGAEWWFYTWETFTDASHVSAVAPGCSTNGNKEYYQKGERYFLPIDGTTDGNQNVMQVAQAETVVPAGHTLTHHPYTAPTATTPGNNEYWSCDVCGKYFSDAAGTTEIADHESVNIPATGLAQVGETKYETFAEAVTAAAGTETITLLANIPDTYTIAADETLKVALNGKNITVAAPENYILNTATAEGVTTYTTTAAVAKIGNNLYRTFADAVADRADNNTVITLLANVEDAVTLTAGETLKVEKGEFTLNVYAPADYVLNTSEAEGVTTYTVALAPSRVTGHTISFKDEIAINYYVYVNTTAVTDVNTLAATYTYGTTDLYRYTHTDLTAQISAVANPDKFDGANYKITCMVNARAMTDDVEMTLEADSEQILSDTYKVTSYSEAAAALYVDNAKLKKLLCDMLDYGATVQNYFNYKTDDLAGDYINNVDADWQRTESPESLVDSTDYSQIVPETFGYSYLGSTLTVTSKTTIRLFFDKTDENIASGTTVKIGDTTYDLLYNEKYHNYYVAITGLAAKNVFDDITLKFTNGDNTGTMAYNLANYYNGAPDTFKNVVKALYQYSASAKAALMS